VSVPWGCGERERGRGPAGCVGGEEHAAAAGSGKTGGAPPPLSPFPAASPRGGLAGLVWTTRRLA
jgi:hypothetical protein